MRHSKTYAVILAAGVGKRLWPLTETTPKPLLPLGEDNLLAYQCRQLIDQGLPAQNILIVAGHHHKQVQANLASPAIRVVYNPEYEQTNNIVTLDYGLGWLEKHAPDLDRLLILNGDTLTHPGIFALFMGSTEQNLAVIDDSKRLTDEAMKVRIQNGQIVEFRKSIGLDSAKGEYIGFSSFSKAGFQSLRSQLQAMIQDGLVNEWYEEGFNQIASKTPIAPLSTAGMVWIEFDDHQDYEEAKKLHSKINRQIRAPEQFENNQSRPSEVSKSSSE